MRWWSVQGRLLRQLQAFVGAEQPSFLPAFGQRAQDFQEGVQMLVYDALMLKVRCKNRGTSCSSVPCVPSNQAIPAEMSICETHLVTHTTLLYRKTLLSSGRYRRSGTGILYCHLQLLESGHAIVGG